MTPPWLFPHRSAKGDSRKPGGSSTPSLSFEDIARIPIPTLIEKDAVVFVWTPDTQLPKVLSLFDVWGLRYNGTAFHWTRTREDTDLTSMHHERDIPIYTGYITRGNPIALVMGVKGEPSLRKHRMEDGTVRPRKDIRKQQFAPYTSGAAHPRFRELVEQDAKLMFYIFNFKIFRFQVHPNISHYCAPWFSKTTIIIFVVH